MKSRRFGEFFYTSKYVEVKCTCLFLALTKNKTERKINNSQIKCDWLIQSASDVLLGMHATDAPLWHPVNLCTMQSMRGSQQPKYAKVVMKELRRAPPKTSVFVHLMKSGVKMRSSEFGFAPFRRHSFCLKGYMHSCVICQPEAKGFEQATYFCVCGR